jgi:hypothetical protein
VLCADSHERILRAKGHANTFVNSCLGFFYNEPKPYGIAHEIRNNRNGVVRLVPRKVLDTSVPFIIGEFFYQLRAALDAAMWAAFEKLGPSPPPPKMNPDALYFPFTKSSDSFKKATFNFIPLPSELKTWIESIQSYNAGKFAIGTPEEQTLIALNMVNKFSAHDRHRKLHIVGTVISSNTALITCTPPAAITYVQNLPANPFEGQYEIAAFGVEGITPETEFNVNGNFSYNILVKDSPIDIGYVNWPYHLADEVLGAVRRFDDLIK